MAKSLRQNPSQAHLTRSALSRALRVWACEGRYFTGWLALDISLRLPENAEDFFVDSIFGE